MRSFQRSRYVLSHEEKQRGRKGEHGGQSKNCSLRTERVYGDVCGCVCARTSGYLHLCLCVFLLVCVHVNERSTLRDASEESHFRECLCALGKEVWRHYFCHFGVWVPMACEGAGEELGGGREKEAGGERET